jgi:hypothetical protein
MNAPAVANVGRLQSSRSQSTTEDRGAGETHPRRRTQLDGILEDANYLLRYAVDAGIEVDAGIAGRIIAATQQEREVWEGPEAGELLAAASKLAAKLHPVTAETLRACREEARAEIRSYKRNTYCLGGVILALSMISFVYTSISNSITADLKSANDLAVTLHLQLDASTQTTTPSAPPNSAVTELQQLAVAMRAIYGRTRQLNVFVANRVGDWINVCEASNPPPPAGAADVAASIASTTGSTAARAVPPASQAGCAFKKMELDPDLQTGSMVSLSKQLSRLTLTYQDVRLFATNVQDSTSVIWGAVGNCILPVLYSLLGACAFVLRAFAQQVEARTFARSSATTARFVIAAIGGGVVGLFNNFSIGPNLSLPPLALAFLVGYAADIFFSFLEGSLHSLGRGQAR